MNTLFNSKQIDATLIARGLYQGSVPSPGGNLASVGFTGVVFMAREYQPKASRYPGVRVIAFPLDDFGFPLKTVESDAVNDIANNVIQEIRRGGKVLVTCMAGRNRSGLVVATVLCKMKELSGEKAVYLIRQLRFNALTNPQFVDHLVRTYR